MRRVLAAEVLACARCGGRLRRIATLEAFETAWRIRRHLDVPTSLARIAARRSAPRGHTTPLPSLRDHLPFRALLEEIRPRWQQLIAWEEQHRPAGA
jgi:hypothetical protein